MKMPPEKKNFNFLAIITLFLKSKTIRFFQKIFKGVFNRA